ncbi:MAG: nitroreductase [Chloroflexi bacterium]|nr:nitroreductase [Chloroflexota bacterium]
MAVESARELQQGAGAGGGIERRTTATRLSPQDAAVLRAIRTRRSHTFVLPEAPPREAIETLLEAANHAPNHHLTQPWRFFVCTGDARLRLGEAVLTGIEQRWPRADPEQAAARRKNVPRSFLRAPVVIAVAAAPPGHPHTAPWEELAATAAAIQNLLLAAHAMGLAAYWRSNGTGLDTVKEFLDLEAEAQLVGFVYVGYPDPAATLPEKPRRPYAEFVRWFA